MSRTAAVLVAFVLALTACTAATGSVAPTPAQPTRASGQDQSPTTTRSAITTTTTTTLPPPTARLEARSIWLFPGPAHFEGDRLTAQLPLGDFEPGQLESATLLVDGEALDVDGRVVGDPLLGASVVFADAIETEGASGRHTVMIDAVVGGTAYSASHTFHVERSADRPAQEDRLAWVSSSSPCCTVRHLEGSAAERDIDDVLLMLEDASSHVEATFDMPVENIELVLVDLLWGNGGYAGSEVVISYLDRDFGPRTDETVALTFVHELTHALASGLDGPRTPWPLDEALAVYVTGGHYSVEPHGPRAKALLDLGLLVPLDAFFDGFRQMQHEARYVQAGALAAFITEQFGWEALIDVYGSDTESRSWSAWMDETSADVLDLDLVELDAAFVDWVESHDAGAQLEHLELTIALQEARRDYQARFAPYPNYFIYESVTELPTPASAVREARSPAVAAFEAFVGHAQGLLLEGDADAAAPLVTEIARIVETSEVQGDAVTPFLELALSLDRAGLELLGFDPLTGTALATEAHPTLVDVVADTADGRLTGWTTIESAVN